MSTDAAEDRITAATKLPSQLPLAPELAPAFDWKSPAIAGALIFAWALFVAAGIGIDTGPIKVTPDFRTALEKAQAFVADGAKPPLNGAANGSDAGASTSKGNPLFAQNDSGSRYEELPGIASSVLYLFIASTWTNVLFLACFSILIARYASSTSTSASALSIAFLIFLVVMSGQAIVGLGIEPVADGTAPDHPGEMLLVARHQRYLRVAAMVSLLSFLAVYDPTSLGRFLKFPLRVASGDGKQARSPRGRQVIDAGHGNGDAGDGELAYIGTADKLANEQNGPAADPPFPARPR